MLFSVCGSGTPRNGLVKNTSLRVLIVSVSLTSVPGDRFVPDVQADGFEGHESETLTPLGVEPSLETPYLLMSGHEAQKAEKTYIRRKAVS